MSQQSILIGILLLMAIILSNLPFLSHRIFGILALRKIKPSWVTALELLISYFMLGSLAYFFETSLGNIFPQKWPFYVVTFILFITLGYPGFVYRYLRRSS